MNAFQKDENVVPSVVEKSNQSASSQIADPRGSGQAKQPSAESHSSPERNEQSSSPGVSPERIGKIEDRLKKLESSLAAKIVVVLGIIGGLTALPKTAYDTWSILAHKPVISWGDTIELRFDPATEKLALIFSVSTTNESTKIARVTSASCEFDVPGPIFVSKDDIELREGSVPVRFPFSLGAAQAKDLNVSVVVARDLSPLALAQEGRRVLDVSFLLEGQSQPVSHKYCTPPLDRDDLQALKLNAEPTRVPIAHCN
jgi:hypothetical protein